MSHGRSRYVGLLRISLHTEKPYIMTVSEESSPFLPPVVQSHSPENSGMMDLSHVSDSIHE